MSSENWPWDALGLEGEISDKRKLKSAYASKLKDINQAEDVEAFTKLREAYDYALAVCGEQEEHEGFRQYDSLILEEDKVEEGISSPAYEEEPSDNVTAQSEVEAEEKLTDRETVSETEAGADGLKVGVTEEISNTVEEKSFVELHQEDGKHEGDESDDENWDYLLSLSNKMQELSESKANPYDVEAWTVILDDPSVVSFEARQYIEEQVFRTLLEATSYGSGASRPVAPDEMTAEFVELIDNHFGWVTDGVSFTRRFGDAGEWVLQAITVSRLRFREIRDDYRGDSVVVVQVEPMPLFLRWYVLLGAYLLYRMVVMT